MTKSQQRKAMRTYSKLQWCFAHTEAEAQEAYHRAMLWILSAIQDGGVL